MSAVGFEDKLYPPTKIIGVVDLLATEGIGSVDALRGVGVSFEQLQRTETRISLNQVLESYRNAIGLSRNRHFAFHLGLRQHMSAYGFYGFAMLCCPDLRRTMEFAVRYHPLAVPTSTIAFEERDRRASWTIQPIPHPKIDGPMYRFITEFQIALHISLMRDVESSFVPLEVNVTYPPEDSGITVDVTACPVRFGQPESQIIFDAAWLNRTPGMGHRTTYPEIVALCDQHLADLTLRTGPAGRVRRILLQDLASRPTFADVAKALRTPTRTLRRQLRRQSTSFRRLVDELRAHLAVKYLRETAMTSEDIGFALGFGDAATFRRAFSRWTGKSPNAFRRQQNPIGVGLMERLEASGKRHKHSIDIVGTPDR